MKLKFWNGARNARATVKTVLVAGSVLGAASLHAELSNQVWFVTWNGAPTPSGDVALQNLSTAGDGAAAVAGTATNFVTQVDFPSFNSPYEVAVDPAMGKAYVLDNNLRGVTPEYIYSFNLTGTPAQIAAGAQIIYTLPVPQADVGSGLYPLLAGIALDAVNHQLYFCQMDATTGSNSYIGRLDLITSSKSDAFSAAGGNPTLHTYYTGQIPGAGKIALDGTNLYLAAVSGPAGNAGIFAVPLAGGGTFSEIVTLSSGDVNFTNGLVAGIARNPQNNLLYYLTSNAGYVNGNFDTNQNAVWTYDIAGRVRTKISSGYPGYPDNVALDPVNSRYYFTTGQDGTGNVAPTNYQAIYTGILGTTNAPMLFYTPLLGGQDTAANAGNVAIQGIYVVDVGVAAPAVVTLNSSTLNQVYNGLPRTVTAGTTPAGLAQTMTYNGSTMPPTGAGSYTVVAIVTDPNHTGSAIGTLTVAPAPLTVTAKNATRIYGAANPAFTAGYGGLLNGDSAGVISGSPAFTAGAAAGSPVGAYQITPATGTLSAANYSFGPFLTGTLTVTPAALTVTANNAGRAYGGANPGFTAGYSGFVNGDTAAVVAGSPVFTTSATSGSPIGTNTITPVAGSLSAANYTFGPFLPGTLTVTSAVLTVTAKAVGRVYGVTNPVFSGTVTGFVSGENQGNATTGTLAFTTPATGANPVGGYAINGAGLTANNGNYIFVQAAANATALTITAAPLIITAIDESKTYGATFTPDGTSQFTRSGLLNGDRVTSVALTSGGYAAAAGVAGSPYPISPGAATGIGVGNYAITYVAGHLTVTPATLTVTAGDKTKAYGAAPPTLTASYSGFVNGDTAASLTTPAALSTTATTASGAGKYPITCGGVTSSNYKAVFVNGNLTVTPAPLTVTANNMTRIFGAANPVFTGTIAGLQNSDNITATYSCGAGTNSPDGAYPIVPSLVDPQGALSNYTVTINDGVLTIGNPLPVISNPTLTGRTFSVTVQSQPGLTYTLEAENDLSTASWTAVQSVPGTGGAITLTDPNAPAPARFYRVRVQ